VLVVAASLALVVFVAALVVLLRRRERQAAGWAAGSLGAFLLAFALGRLAPLAHPVAAALTLVVAARNTARFEGAARILQAIGLAAWAVAVVAARIVFAR
jgi:hypothetical protein